MLSAEDKARVKSVAFALFDEGDRHADVLEKLKQGGTKEINGQSVAWPPVIVHQRTVSVWNSTRQTPAAAKAYRTLSHDQRATVKAVALALLQDGRKQHEVRKVLENKGSMEIKGQIVVWPNATVPARTLCDWSLDLRAPIVAAPSARPYGMLDADERATIRMVALSLLQDGKRQVEVRKILQEGGSKELNGQNATWPAVNVPKPTIQSWSRPQASVAPSARPHGALNAGEQANARAAALAFFQDGKQRVEVRQILQEGGNKEFNGQNVEWPAVIVLDETLHSWSIYQRALTAVQARGALT